MTSPRTITRNLAAADCGTPCRFCLGQHGAGCIWVAAQKWVKRHPIGVLELLFTGRRKEAQQLLGARWRRFVHFLMRFDHG